MTELKSNVGRKIKSFSIDIAQISHYSGGNEVMVLGWEQLFWGGLTENALNT